MQPQTGFLAFRERRFAKPFGLLILLTGLLWYLGKTFALFGDPSLGLDKLLHFLGGASCGVFGVGLLSMGFWNKDTLCTVRETNLRVWVIAILVALIIGVAFEVLQAFAPIFRNGRAYNWYDTVGDVVFDVLGGIVAGFVYQVRGK